MLEKNAISFHKNLIKFLIYLQNSLILIISLPVVYLFFPRTASQVKARHMLLQKAIGVFPEEEQAYEKISMLSWLLPLTAIIGSLIDTILVAVFMKLAHPWKDILFGQMEQTEETQPIELDIQDVQSKNQVIFFAFI